MTALWLRTSGTYGSSRHLVPQCVLRAVITKRGARADTAIRLTIAWQKAEVVIVAENDLLICEQSGLCPTSERQAADARDVFRQVITLASVMCIITALLGLTGTMLNSRPILAFYNLLLWPSLAAILVVGYTSYKKQNLNLDRKLNQAWSQFFDDEARLRIQNNVGCPGDHTSTTKSTRADPSLPTAATLLWLLQSAS